MQNQASPIPARRQLSQSTTGQAPKTSSLSSGSPSPIRRAPPSYESIRQSPEKSGKIQVRSINLPMIHNTSFVYKSVLYTFDELINVSTIGWLYRIRNKFWQCRIYCIIGFLTRWIYCFNCSWLRWRLSSVYGYVC